MMHSLGFFHEHTRPDRKSDHLCFIKGYYHEIKYVIYLDDSDIFLDLVVGDVEFKKINQNIDVYNLFLLLFRLISAGVGHV